MSASAIATGGEFTSLPVYQSSVTNPYPRTGVSSAIPCTSAAWAVDLETGNSHQRIGQAGNLLRFRVQLTEYYNFGRIEPGRHHRAAPSRSRPAKDVTPWQSMGFAALPPTSQPSSRSPSNCHALPTTPVSRARRTLSGDVRAASGWSPTGSRGVASRAPRVREKKRRLTVSRRRIVGTLEVSAALRRRFQSRAPRGSPWPSRHVSFKI